MAEKVFYAFKNEAGDLTGEQVALQRVSPLLIGQRRALMMAKRPSPTRETVQMADGTTTVVENTGDPAYKAKLATWRASIDQSVIDGLIEHGVFSGDAHLLEGKSSEQLSDLARTIRRISYASPEGVQAISNTADPLLIEGIAAARWADMSINTFLYEADAGFQNLIIAAYRYATTTRG